MKKTVFPKQWLDLHPYRVQQPSDAYYIDLANRLYQSYATSEINEQVLKACALHVAAYLEDVVSELGLWQTFRKAFQRLYPGKQLPFYSIGPDYVADEINREDVCFVIWNTWQKDLQPHPFIEPGRSVIHRMADRFMEILDEAYEEAPENIYLQGFFETFESEAVYDQKLTWLFGHTYLTAPSMAPYIERVAPNDRFIIPTGPLALFLHEWLADLCSHDLWKRIKGIIPKDNPLTKEQEQKNRDYYDRFTAACKGNPITYLDGYEALRRFLTEVLGWPDDEAHTLPQMKEHRNFILMSNPEKGILLAKDVAAWIADPVNPLYDAGEAARHAFRLLTEETLCPPDLLSYCICHGFLPDLQLPDEPASSSWVVPHADFIARHTLLYYYRGD